MTLQTFNKIFWKKSHVSQISQPPSCSHKPIGFSASALDYSILNFTSTPVYTICCTILEFVTEILSHQNSPVTIQRIIIFLSLHSKLLSFVGLPHKILRKCIESCVCIKPKSEKFPLECMQRVTVGKNCYVSWILCLGSYFLFFSYSVTSDVEFLVLSLGNLCSPHNLILLVQFVFRAAQGSHV